MPSNPFQLRPKAAEDLEGIYLYSQKKWGISRAATYIKDINAAFEVLANNAALGRDYSDVRPNLRAYNVAHISFYINPLTRVSLLLGCFINLWIPNGIFNDKTTHSI